MVGTIVFRADASRDIGHGHVMRCLALADSLRTRGNKCLFVSSPDGAALVGEVARRGHRQLTLPVTTVSCEEDAVNTLSGVHGHGPISLVVIDHYGLDMAWESAVRRSGIPVMVIDDLPRPHDCNGLLDQNLIEGNNPYTNCVPANCHFFLGPRYALLRPEFARLRPTAPIRRKVARLLIFFGGSDPRNETGKALQGLLEARREWKIDVVIGAGSSSFDSLEALTSCRPNDIRLHVQTPLMAELMSSADLSIGAGGSASWERCCLRLPAIVSVLAENQVAIAQRLHCTGAAVNLGDAEFLMPADYGAAVAAIDGSRLAALSEAAGSLVDGLGATRLAAELDQLFGSRC